MSNKDNTIFLEHILESARAIHGYIKGVGKASFSLSPEKQDSIIRRLEIIGEAVKKLDKDFKNRYDKVAWDKIAGMRDVLIHDYFGVDVELVWNTVKKDIPKLEKYVKEILKP
jgi:uncharacterized protein with HEPN domain